MFSSMIMIAAMFGIMYFLIIRPQKKQQEKVQDMLSSITVGDSVVTIGGLHGIVDEINEVAKTIVLDCEGIYLTFERRAVSRIISKGTDGAVVTPEDLGTNLPETEEENISEN